MICLGLKVNIQIEAVVCDKVSQTMSNLTTSLKKKHMRPISSRQNPNSYGRDNTWRTEEHEPNSRRVNDFVKNELAFVVNSHIKFSTFEVHNVKSGIGKLSGMAGESHKLVEKHNDTQGTISLKLYV